MNVVQVAPLQTAHINVGVNASASGATAVVAAIPNARIRVLSVAAVTTLANVVKFQSGTTDISASFPLGANGGIVLPFNQHGWFTTNIGEALNANLGTATATGVQVQYIVLPT